MQNTEDVTQEISLLEAQAMRAAQAGREDETVRLWNRILELDPEHIRTWTAAGQYAFRKGDMHRARDAFQKLIDLDGSDAQQWIHLAVVSRNLADEVAEEGAIKKALTLDPSDLVALLLRANLLERRGKTHEAARAYGAAAAVAPPMDRVHPELRAGVAQARAQSEKYNRDVGNFLDAHLDAGYANFRGEKLDRFRTAVDIMVGRKKRYDSQSMIFHYPGLPTVEFFERGDFPWLDAMEAATDSIRDEFLAVLAADADFVPYITYPDDVPHNQWAELNNSPRWSAYHLYLMGKLVEEHAARCPATMAALAHAPQPDEPGRTPAAMYSLLKPRTVIPAHTGVSNVRLVTHLPLIVPEGCSFRVGNTTRQWVPGKAWVFDDTVEHEARNDSDQLRVILLFDIWHPLLTPPEREMITAMYAGVNAFTGSDSGPGAD
jgi:aspartyl/asparaginyl beta-hydroxylase (cupin superfamily)